MTPIPVTAKTAFLIIDNLRFPSSVHQLFCGRIQTAILMIAEIHTIAFTAAGILKSIANKGISILNKGNLEDIIAFTGGLAKSKELVKMLEEKLNKKIFIAEDTQIIGALGAAIIGFK